MVEDWNLNGWRILFIAYPKSKSFYRINSNTNATASLRCIPPCLWCPNTQYCEKLLWAFQTGQRTFTILFGFNPNVTSTTSFQVPIEWYCQTVFVKALKSRKKRSRDLGKSEFCNRVWARNNTLNKIIILLCLPLFVIITQLCDNATEQVSYYHRTLSCTTSEMDPQNTSCSVVDLSQGL